MNERWLAGYRAPAVSAYPPSPQDSAVQDSLCPTDVVGADPAMVHGVGQLWSIEAAGLDPARLSGSVGVDALTGLFGEIVRTLGLQPVTETSWHVFPGPHEGVTGLLGLSESHLSLIHI